MIQITPHMRILVAVEPIDFRAGIDRLVGACRQRLDPHVVRALQRRLRRRNHPEDDRRKSDHSDCHQKFHR